MLKVIMVVASALGVDIDSISKDNSPQGIIDAFDKAWQKICDGKEVLLSQLAEATEREKQRDLLIVSMLDALKKKDARIAELEKLEEFIEELRQKGENYATKAWSINARELELLCAQALKE
jgi:hypothetical protein